MRSCFGKYARARVLAGINAPLEKERRWELMRKQNKLQGRLGFNTDNGRYGLLSSDLWINCGFHCGDCLEVEMDGRWEKTRMEMMAGQEWYLVGTPYCGNLEFVRARIPA